MRFTAPKLIRAEDAVAVNRIYALFVATNLHELPKKFVIDVEDDLLDHAKLQVFHQFD